MASKKGEKKEEGETFSTSMPIATKSIDVRGVLKNRLTEKTGEKLTEKTELK
jgi:hypothetical protein